MKYLIYHFSSLQDFKRLDFALSQMLNITRSYISNLINLNLIFVNNKIAKKSQKLQKKDVVEIYALKMQDKEQHIKSDLKIDIIYENDDFLILNKPKDLAVHSGNGINNITLSEYLKDNNYQLSNIGNIDRLGIVHRLDKDTSGAILIAKNNNFHIKFATLLKNRYVEKIYICIINKALKNDCTLHSYIMRDPKNRLKMISVNNTFEDNVLQKEHENKNMRYAKSEFRKILESNNSDYEIIAIRIFTGRTHQIRAHLASMNRFIYGDSLYSTKDLVKSYDLKMLLHSSVLCFENKVFIAKLHIDLIKFMNKYFDNYKEIVESKINTWINEIVNDKINALDSNIDFTKYSNFYSNESYNIKNNKHDKVCFENISIGELF